MSDIKVSIITASYNYENYIRETIESVINQSFKDWEMIIVDDGSTDNSIEVIQSYCTKDNRIKLFTHQNNENRGLSETIKLGIDKSSVDWLIFLESDDTITPDYIEKKLQIIKQHPNIKFIYNDINMFGDEERINEKNKFFEKLYKKLSKVSFPANVAKMLKSRNIVFTFSCVMLNKEVLNGINWEARDKRMLDWFLWAQIASKYDFYFLDEKLTNWRISKTSYINHRENDIDTIYFCKVQIPDIVCGKRLIHRINFFRKYFGVYMKNIINNKSNKKLQ